MVIRMIYEIVDIYKYLNEFKENTNKQLNKIRKTMQDMKMEFSKVTEILKKKI
jgi:chaperonin cofactor prefoldin